MASCLYVFPVSCRQCIECICGRRHAVLISQPGARVSTRRCGMRVKVIAAFPLTQSSMPVDTVQVQLAHGRQIGSELGRR